MQRIVKILAVSAVVVALVVSIGVTKSYKSSNQAWLGVVSQTVNEDLAEGFDLSIDRGAIINQVLRDSPAEQAGLEEGDIIISFAGQHVGDYDDLVDLIEDHMPGDTVDVKIMRDKDELQLKVTLEDKPRNRHYRYSWFSDEPRNFVRVPSVSKLPRVPKMPRVPRVPDIDNYYWTGDFDGAYIGVHMDELNRQLGEFFGVEKGRGVLISEVDKDSPAEKSGLEAGDVIVAIDGEKVAEYEDVTDVIHEKEEGDKITLTIVRDKKEQSVDVEVGWRDDESVDHAFIFNGPDLNIKLPHMKGLRYGVFSDDWLEDIEFEELQGFNEELDDEMEDLLDELKDLKSELKDLESEHSDEWREEMRRLRDELQDIKRKLD